MSSKAHTSSSAMPSNLPDDFFDSHKKSKKNQEDDLAKELEQFEKDMAALEAESEEQLREEFEKLQDDKNIDELDQQLEQWKRIVELETRAEELQSKTLSEKPTKRMKIDSEKSNSTDLKNIIRKNQDTIDGEIGNEDSSNDIEDFEDKLANWRFKGL